FVQALRSLIRARSDQQDPHALLGAAPPYDPLPGELDQHRAAERTGTRDRNLGRLRRKCGGVLAYRGLRGEFVRIEEVDAWRARAHAPASCPQRHAQFEVVDQGIDTMRPRAPIADPLDHMGYLCVLRSAVKARV